jgi:hypothetical protein
VGDTTYQLTTLTQSRYGRGGAFNVSQPKWDVGARYTQNPWKAESAPKDICGFLGFKPLEDLYM